MRRRIVSLALCLLLFASCLPAFADGEDGTEIWFSNATPVCGITAYYDVLTENVESIDVEFDAAITGIAFANYVWEENQLRIAIASDKPIDLTEAVGTATATLTDGLEAAPQIRLTMLKFDGEAADSNAIPQSVSAKLDGGILTAALAMRDDLLGSVNVLIAVYAEDGKYLGMKQKTLRFTSAEQTFTVSVGRYQNAAAVKVMLLNDGWQPYRKALNGAVQ